MVPLVERVAGKASSEAWKKSGRQSCGHLGKSIAGRRNCKIRVTEAVHSWKATGKSYFS